MHSSTNLPHTGISSSFLVTTSTTSNSKSLGFNSTRKIHINSTTTKHIRCKAASSASSWITEFDLYDLLGIDSSSDQAQIKSAYRALQKQCHPDIAGPTGHDMAIILNQAYSVLSDPSSRFVYDKEQSKISELRGYTGKPIYSTWYGSESENRAVFVDEVKCIGCLKCALLADKTFAVESVYGRARVVSQWADSENKIQEAIDACPVDCISIVERSNLAALEFLMSKQPRGNVRVGASNAVGARVSNIFVDVMKFQTRFQNSMDKKASSVQYTEPESQREARSAAIQTIRSISNWLYWKKPNSNSQINTSLTITGRKTYSKPKNINKLREAVAARKQALEDGIQIPSSKDINKEEYWYPSTLVLPQVEGFFTNSGEPVPTRGAYTEENNATINKEVDYYEAKKGKEKKNSLARGFIPIVAAIIAGTIINQQIKQGSVGRLEEHIGGSFALGIVNSSWSQVILAGITWYLISMYVIELIQAFASKVGVHKTKVDE